MCRYDRIGSARKSKKKEGFVYVFDKESKALIECNCVSSDDLCFGDDGEGREIWMRPRGSSYMT